MIYQASRLRYQVEQQISRDELLTLEILFNDPSTWSIAIDMIKNSYSEDTAVQSLLFKLAYLGAWWVDGTVSTDREERAHEVVEHICGTKYMGPHNIQELDDVQHVDRGRVVNHHRHDR